MATSVDVERENERMRWREEWPEHSIIACGRICQRAVTEKRNRRQMQAPTVYSLLSVHHLSILEKFLLVCRNYLPLSQQMYTRERTCCDSPKASGVSSRSPYVIKVLKSGAVRSLQ